MGFDNGIGYISDISVVREGDTTNREFFLYDKMGAVVQHGKYIGSKLRYMEYEYDMLGRMTLMRYPNGEEEVKFSYDQSGRLQSMYGSYYNWDFIQDIQYNPNGQINSVEYGNGIKDLYEYDDAYRVSVIKTVDWYTDPLMELGYSYDNVGNVTAIENSIHPDRSQSFNYDNLDRLVSASGVYGDNFYTYNNIGNIETVHRNGPSVKTYLYEDPAHVHAVTKNMEYGYDYDGAGNMINKHNPWNTDIDYIYDWNNRLIEVIDNNGSNGSSTNPPEWALSAVYSLGDECTYEDIIYECLTPHTALAADWTPNRTPALWTEIGATGSGSSSATIFKADYNSTGNRVKTVEGDVTTYYFFPGYKEEYGSNSECKETKYYYAIGRKIAKCVNDGDPVFYHSDHLGSTTLITDNGYPNEPEVVYDMGYKPYGQIAYSSGSIEEPKYKYNDKEMDNSTGLYYYGARYYDPDLARFITADWVTPGGGYDSQGLNRYTYCLNNPVKFIDPDGSTPVATGLFCGGVAAIANLVLSGMDNWVDSNKHWYNYSGKQMGTAALAFGGGFIAGATGAGLTKMIADYSTAIVGAKLFVDTGLGAGAMYGAMVATRMGVELGMGLGVGFAVDAGKNIISNFAGNKTFDPQYDMAFGNASKSMPVAVFNSAFLGVFNSADWARRTVTVLGTVTVEVIRKMNLLKNKGTTNSPQSINSSVIVDFGGNNFIDFDYDWQKDMQDINAIRNDFLKHLDSRIPMGVGSNLPGAIIDVIGTSTLDD